MQNLDSTPVAGRRAQSSPRNLPGQEYLEMELGESRDMTVGVRNRCYLTEGPGAGKLRNEQNGRHAFHTKQAVQSATPHGGFLSKLGPLRPVMY